MYHVALAQILGGRSEPFDHLNDRQAKSRIADPEERPDEPRALFRITGLRKIRFDRGRDTELSLGLSARILVQHCTSPKRTK